MSENSEPTTFLSFTTSDRNRMSERQLVHTRGNGAPVLSFRSKQTPSEPDDARITGATRSLYRRLLALNLRKPVANLRETEPYVSSLTA